MSAKPASSGLRSPCDSRLASDDPNHWLVEAVGSGRIFQSCSFGRWWFQGGLTRNPRTTVSKEYLPGSTPTVASSGAFSNPSSPYKYQPHAATEVTRLSLESRLVSRRLAQGDRRPLLAGFADIKRGSLGIDKPSGAENFSAS